MNEYEEKDLVVYEGKKHKVSGSGTKKCLPVEAGDVSTILDMAIEAGKNRLGRPAEFPNNKQGLDDFVNRSIDYFEHITTVNADDGLERKIIPDIESWAAYLGVTRQTIWSYEQRGSEWKQTVQYYKGIILATKKQLAYNFRVPAAVFIFDACNNFGYSNTSEFKLTAETATPEKSNDLDEQIREAGLIWNEETKTFEPAED